MKHIKRKFQFEVEKSSDLAQAIMNKSQSLDIDVAKKTKFGPEMGTYIGTDAGKLIQVFQYNYQGSIYQIPEPDPVLIYFNAAYWALKNIENIKPKLFESLDGKSISSKMTHLLYNYFSSCASFVTNLFYAIEAFINKSIPDDYIYECDEKKYVKIYNKIQVLEYIDFKTKLTIIMKEVSNGRDYSKSPNTQRILSLKELRDAIVHTKTKANDGSPYKHIFKKCLDYKYEESLESAKAYINHYASSSDYIQDCECGKDF